MRISQSILVKGLKVLYRRFFFTDMFLFTVPQQRNNFYLDEISSVWDSFRESRKGQESFSFVFKMYVYCMYIFHLKHSLLNLLPIQVNHAKRSTFCFLYWKQNRKKVRNRPFSVLEQLIFPSISLQGFIWFFLWSVKYCLCCYFGTRYVARMSF